MPSSPDKLTVLQRELLAAFFAHERRFFLTGGAALAGFYLHHRTTDDLDFFTHEKEAFETGGGALAAAADDVRATTTVRQNAPGFRRYVVSRGDESVVVDLVWERVPSAYPDKVETAGVRVDPIEEILVNKLTTVVSRSEERDIVDLLILEQRGLRIEDGLAAALAKDGGCTPAALAFVLSEVVVPDSATLPGGVSPAALRSFIADLVVRLRRLAHPGT